MALCAHLLLPLSMMHSLVWTAVLQQGAALSAQWCSLLPPLQVKHYRVKKQTKFLEFRQMLADDLEVPLEQQRFWTWAKRQNSTYRPNNILTPADDERRVMDLKVHYPAKGGLTCQVVELLARHAALACFGVYRPASFVLEVWMDAVCLQAQFVFQQLLSPGASSH